MPSRERPADRGNRLARADLVRVGAELRQGRVSAGLSLSTVSAAVGISGSQIARIERGLVSTASVSQIARIGAVVGFDVRIRAYPESDPLRDAGQVRLLERLRSRLHPGLSMRLEVPMPIVGDRRAWDAWIGDLLEASERMRDLPVEAETRFADAQAQIRRIMLKMRDAQVDHVLLVVAETPGNRRAVAAAADLITGSFPVSGRKAMAALAAGKHPGGSSLVFI